MKDILEVPEGQLTQGIKNIAKAVLQRLKSDGKAFVRHTESAGGYGNRRFVAEGDRMPSLNDITEKLEGEHPELWQDASALVERYLDITHSPAVSFSKDGFLYDNLQITCGSEYWGSWSPVPPEIWPEEELENIGFASGRRLREEGYVGPGNNDLAIVRNPYNNADKLVGIEINARMTAVRHAIEIGELCFNKPWSTWRQSGHVIKSLDHFVTNKEMSFKEVHDTLGREGLLASAEQPYGAVITIPPYEDIVGIQVQANGYRKTEALYQKVHSLIGHPTANTHDNPYVPNKT